MPSVSAIAYWIIVGGAGLLGFGVIATALLVAFARLRQPSHGAIAFVTLTAICVLCYWYEVGP